MQKSLIVLLQLLLIFFTSWHQETFAADNVSVSHQQFHHELQYHKMMEEKLKQLDGEYAQWFQTYEAASPQHQQWCKDVLIQSKPKGNGQFAQDTFLFFNLFKWWPMRRRLGYYVDSGANAPVEGSNTFFFDKCLGWKGLCVEPMPQFHEGLSSSRSCTLIKECISSKNEMVFMSNRDVLSEVLTKQEPGSMEIQCSPLADMLSRAGLSDPLVIDLWSLDVEGFEMTVLRAIDFTKIHIKVILVESAWLSNRELDLFLTSQGFVKYQHMALDSVFVNLRYLMSESQMLSSTVWYPPGFQQRVNEENEWRKTQTMKVIPGC